MKDMTSPEDFRNDRKKDKIAFERFISEDDEAVELSSGEHFDESVDEWQDNMLTAPEKIEAAIKRQMALYKRKNEILSRLLEEELILKKKRKILKAARKKADEKKTGKKLLSLIKADLAFIGEARYKCEEMIVNERTEIEKISAVITTLKSLL